MRLLPILLLLAQQSFVSPEDVFRTAEELYSGGRYAEAAEQYEILVGQGVRDGSVCYNLGNAYFKSGRLGLAILNYERALEQMPGDADAKAKIKILLQFGFIAAKTMYDTTTLGGVMIF